MKAHFSEARVKQDVKQQPGARPEGSPAAILYERHAVPILAYLRLHAPTWEAAEDILQEVFLATMNHRHIIDLPEQQQLAWLGGIARHKLVDHYRHARRRTTAPLDPMLDEIEEAEALTPESVVLGQEQQRELWQAVKRLPALQQRVVYLRFAAGLRSPQIASLLGKREEAVRKALSRAMNQLRSFYQQPERG
jgi:RNA polymerase sigma-70 factor (ECF subfamily)